MFGKSLFGMVAGVLTVVGALNWGLIGVGVFLNRDLNVVRMVTGTVPAAEAVVYILVGLGAVWVLIESIRR
ncbi:MAG: DUF378 domain-containing protein [Candidatus Peribacter sp.]|nr:DUF378 domain-containing protein [Candidatus Peribacter sp.]